MTAKNLLPGTFLRDTVAAFPKIVGAFLGCGKPSTMLKTELARVFLIGSYRLNRAALRALIESRGTFEAVGDPQMKKPEPATELLATLTRRERDIVSVTLLGLKNRQVADRLFISETTVRHHLTSIFNKLGVRGRFELLRFAYQHGLAKAPQ